MSIRLRVILAIVLVNLAIILFSVLAGIAFVKSSIERSQETDLTTIASIADRFVSSEIELLELKAAGAARALAGVSDAGARDALEELAERDAPHPVFTGMALFDAGAGLIASAGESPAPPETADDPYVRQAFEGKSAFSSTVQSEGGIVLYLAVPVAGGRGRVLALTLPGMYFTERLSAFSIWKTGHIFLDDAEGYVIANRREEWVQNRVNFVLMAKDDPQYEPMAAVIRQALRGEAGTGRFSVFGVPRLCAFRPVSGSRTGWCLGVIAPLPESPFHDIDRGLIVVGLVSLALSAAAAVSASGFIQKPFAEVAALKDAAEASSKSKGDFLTNMSYEIRTPMNAILGVAEILTRDEALRPEAREGLRRISGSADLLLSIINDILDLSRIEEGSLGLASAPYELASLINDTVTLNVARAGDKEIEFDLSVDEAMPSHLFGDALRVRQILNNLLSNAFKYTERGRVRLAFSAEGWDGEAESALTLVCRVSDTGRGMTEEQLSRIFDKYTRFDAEANRAIEGVGLGMNIARHLARLMDGTISAESEPDIGSVFTVRLPQRSAGPGALGGEMAENLRGFRASCGEHLKRARVVFEPMPYGRVLLVDDVESNLYVTKGLLAPYGMSVDTARSGFEAIDKIRNGGTYDIVFMDHMMPKMDGIEAARIMRGLGYEAPIVALTANALPGQADAFLSNGFDGFVSKPIDVRQLDAELKKHVRNRQPPEVRSAARAPAKQIVDDALDSSMAVKPRLAEIFVQDARRALSVLETLREGRLSRGGEDFRLCALTAHGLKAALTNVGEQELAAAAASLESAGNEKDAAAVSAELPAFIEALRAVIGKLTPGE